MRSSVRWLIGWSADLGWSVFRGSLLLGLLFMRLKTEIWVKGYLRARSSENVMAVLSRRGDEDAGAVFIIVDMMNGQCRLFGPAPAGLEIVDRQRRWEHCFTDESVDLDRAREYINRQLDMDPDIWVVEVEDRLGRDFLDDAVVRD